MENREDLTSGDFIPFEHNPFRTGKMTSSLLLWRHDMFVLQPSRISNFQPSCTYQPVALNADRSARTPEPTRSSSYHYFAYRGRMGDGRRRS
ncbi:hypothetical protein QC763_0027960 [Podospora pseudopauciseta]|uniref:Uncharacterized protein n=1 Tax=Podospora pseudopauciseta TaxID=2093780 RepID=A0ABR0I3G7_9PEZI|nr:hypothetical protein QC763_0027960 [Podospora pseudopauciseta]